MHRSQADRRRSPEHPHRRARHCTLLRHTTEIDSLTLKVFQTSTTLTYLVYLLSLHPDVLRRLREEVLSRVGPTRCPDSEDMREMKYMRAVINGMDFKSFPANLD